MSHEISTKETIKIKVIDEASRTILDKIIERFNCLNRGDCISSGSLNYIALTVDGQTVTEKNNWERYIGEKPVFKVDSALMRLLNKSDITEFEMILEYSAMVHGGFGYGCSFFWDLYNKSDKSALANLQYKVLEYYDYDTEFTAFRLCNGEVELIEPNINISDITDVESWFSDNFSLGVSSDDDLDEEVANKVRQLFSGLKEKYNLDDQDFVIWEDAMFFGNSFSIDHVSIPELIKDIDRFARFAKENNLKLILDGVFTPFDHIPKFAYFTFPNDENGTDILAAKF